MIDRHDYYTLPRILKQRVSTLAIKQTSLAFILKVGLFCCKKKVVGVLFLTTPYLGTFCRKRGLKSVLYRVNLLIFMVW